MTRIPNFGIQEQNAQYKRRRCTWGDDGSILRSKEFKPYDPEWFALHACTSIVAFVVPVTITPTVLAAVPIVGTFFLSRVIANLHRRGG